MDSANLFACNARQLVSQYMAPGGIFIARQSSVVCEQGLCLPAVRPLKNWSASSSGHIRFHLLLLFLVYLRHGSPSM